MCEMKKEKIDLGLYREEEREGGGAIKDTWQSWLDLGTRIKTRHLNVIMIYSWKNTNKCLSTVASPCEAESFIRNSFFFTYFCCKKLGVVVSTF